MNKIVLYTSLSVISLVLFLFSCNTENDFYEVGRQPVNLTYPVNDTVWVLDYQKPDTMYRFAWESRRNFIEYNLIFSLSSDLQEKRTVIHPGVRNDFNLTTIKLDSILSTMDILIGENADIYWTVEVVDSLDGWCDDMRKINITRCDLPTNVIMLDTPESLAEIILDKENPTDSVTFTWNCLTNVSDYVLQLSFTDDFANVTEVQKGSEKFHKFSHEDLDKLLVGNNTPTGESMPVFWRVNATGTQINPIENSASREITIRRFARDPADVILTDPAMNSEVLLMVENAEEMVNFKWECDTAGVAFKVKLYDTELGKSVEFDAGENNTYSISQSDLDQMLELEFEMVASQKKKLYWEIIPSDTLMAVSKNTGRFTIRRFLAIIAAQPITLTAGPADNTAYTLDYQNSNASLSTVTWDCSALNVTYAIEYSLNSDMSLSKIKPLDKTKTVEFTHSLLDELLSNAGASYLTKKLFWRITSTVSVQTAPTETRSLNLTGMLKPLIDKRNPAKSETYAIVKIGNDFWMAENLRATAYSDGTAFTAVDVVSKTFTGAPVGNENITGQYYTWPTALRNHEAANTSETTIIQGVCPDGWHVSTMAEWKALISAMSPSPSLHAKNMLYWPSSASIDNSSGLGIVPAGVFWHNNLTVPDNGADKAGFWTTTTGPNNSTAYMYEFFDWSQSIDPWHYPCRPWIEGDGTASRLVNVRCVRDLE